MPTIVHVTHQPEAVDPYAELNTAYGKNLLQLFKKGASLCVWRCTTPWNYYLETAGRVQYAIYGKDVGEAGKGRGQLRALDRLSKPGERSNRVIERSLSRFEVGLPESEKWVYDVDKAKALEAYWVSTQKLFKQRCAARKPYSPNVATLSEAALGLLRTLRDDPRIISLPRYPELEDAFCELDAQGIIEMMRTGYYTLVPAAKTIRLPRGRRLKFSTVEKS